MSAIDETELYRLIGSKVRSIREGRKLSQSQLAELLDLTRTSVTNIEKGMQKLPLHVLYKLCLKLSLSFEDVLPDIRAVATHPTLVANNVAIPTTTGNNVVVSKKSAKLIAKLKSSAKHK